MINIFINNLKNSTQFFISFGIVILFAILFSFVILNGLQKITAKRITFLFILGLCFNIIFSSFLFFIYGSLTKYSFDILNLYMLFTLVLSTGFNFSLIVSIKKEMTKAKKSSDFTNSVNIVVKKSFRNILDSSLFYVVFLLAVIIMTGGEVASFIKLLFLPIFSYLFVSAFATRLICKTSERIYK